MATSIKVSRKIIEEGDFQAFTKNMMKLGRKTSEEIDPATWRKALKKHGVENIEDLYKLLDIVGNKRYLKIIFDTTNFRQTKQQIIFDASD